MMTKDDILLLKTKLLPPGAEAVIDFLAARHSQLESTNIVLENVPLLIIGRHGMIARLPLNGRIKKVSQAEEILPALQAYFNNASSTDKLFVFINLPELPIPPEVQQVLSEVEARAMRREEIRMKIDRALDERNREAFDRAVKELEELMREEDSTVGPAPSAT